MFRVKKNNIMVELQRQNPFAGSLKISLENFTAAL